MPSLGKEVPGVASNVVPRFLRPFHSHGVMAEVNGSGEASCECPFCGGEKFSINVETGQWQCFKGGCQSKGNVATFLAQVWKQSLDQTADYSSLLQSRGLLQADTLAKWGAAWSTTNQEWVVPAWNPNRAFAQLYRWSVDPMGKRKSAMFATAEVGLHLYGMNLWDATKSDVFICEGPWDAMALWEVMRNCRMDDQGTFSPTSSESIAILANSNVVATPSCSVFLDTWLPLMEGKRVFLCYDSDHPKKNPKTEAVMEPAGYQGMRKVAQMLARHTSPPKEIRWLQWGSEGYDPQLPSGLDIRDVLTSEEGMSGRCQQLGKLMTLLQPIPANWVPGRTKEAEKEGRPEIACIPCTSWKVLVNAFRKYMSWTPGLDLAFSVALAACASTRTPGSQVWVQLISPAGSGKTEICDALNVNRRYVTPKENIRGFHSGYKMEGGTDCGLVDKLWDKMLVTKDGDALLQSPNYQQILAEARGLFDRNSTTDYRNGVSKDYANHNMVWLLCGTNSLRTMDSSELGERFIRVSIMDEISEELEDDICHRIVDRVDRNMGTTTTKEEAGIDPDKLRAMQLTGGYVDYLQSVVHEHLATFTIPKEHGARVVSFAKFVACMRARPSTRQQESSERELASRLTEQLAKLTKALVVVLGKKEVDKEVMRRVRLVAQDTAKGRTLDIARHLARVGEKGLSMVEICARTGHPEKQEQYMVDFLRRPSIGVVTSFCRVSGNGVVMGTVRYKLTPKLAKLYNIVMGGEK